jgi:hypothetical protein
MVKLQFILEKIQQSPWNAKSDGSSVSMPIILLVNSVEEQLKQFQNEFSPQMEGNSQSSKSLKQCFRFEVC